MNRTIITAIFAMASFTGVRAQNPSVLWIDSANPAGIRQDTTATRTASAELYAGMSAGGFRQTWEASLPWNAGARAYALVHFNGLSLEGSFSFDQIQGNGMCGSMMVRPGYYPVDVLEFTPGKKTRQTYSFAGAISADVSANWRIGAGIDFISANYSKRKDLRHSNYFLDFSIAPGFVWHNGDWSVGANLLFSKNSDTPTARQVGTKDTFDAFLDKGLMFGRYELWDGSGVHLSDAGVNGFPVRELQYGAGVQLQKGSLYAAIDYGYAAGRAGEKQQIWFRFPSQQVKADLGGAFRGNAGQHSLRLRANWKGLENNETVLDKYNEGGVTYYREVASRRILYYDHFEAAFSYQYEDGMNKVCAEMSAGFRTSTSSIMFPYIYDRITAGCQATLNYDRVLGRFTLGAHLGGRYADMRENSRTSSSAGTVDGEPFRLKEWNDLAVEWAVAPRLNAGLRARCQIWKGIYVRMDLGYVHAFNVKLLPGADRYSGEIALGYEF